MAAGSVTTSEETYGTVKKIAFAWTSGTGAEGGTASGTTANAYSGEIIRMVTVPGAAGNQPTDQYDITITDQDSLDVLNSLGANRSNASNEQVISDAVSSLGCVANDKLTINVTNAGDAKTGTAYLYIR